MKLLCFLLFMPLFFFFSSCTIEISNPLDNVYSGITETGENDPAPIGAVDEDDWRMQVNGQNASDRTGIPIESGCCAYPNPTDDYISFQFSLPSSSSVKIFISDKPGSIIDTLVNETLPTGYHRVTYDTRGLKSRIYRAFFLATSGEGIKYSCYGDFRRK